jgi:hypothetical protein
VAPVLLGQVPGEGLVHPAQRRPVRVVDEQGQPAAPVVVAAGLVVEAEHVRAGAQPPSRVPQARRLPGEQRRDEVAVERLGERGAGQGHVRQGTR